MHRNLQFMLHEQKHQQSSYMHVWDICYDLVTQLQTPRLIPESPIGMTLYHSISDPRITPLLLDMSSLSYFLFKHYFTLPYLLFPALPSAMRICSVLLISEFPASPSKPLDFPYTFTIPSGLRKSFVLFSYRLQTI